MGSLDRCRRQDSRRCQGNARDRPDAARALAARPSGMSGRLWGAFLPPLFGWVTLGVAMGLLPVVVLLYAIVMLACTETVNRLLRDVAPVPQRKRLKNDRAEGLGEGRDPDFRWTPPICQAPTHVGARWCKERGQAAPSHAIAFCQFACDVFPPCPGTSNLGRRRRRKVTCARCWLSAKAPAAVQPPYCRVTLTPEISS